PDTVSEHAPLVDDARYISRAARDFFRARAAMPFRPRPAADGPETPPATVSEHAALVDGARYISRAARHFFDLPAATSGRSGRAFLAACRYDARHGPYPARSRSHCGGGARRDGRRAPDCTVFDALSRPRPRRRLSHPGSPVRVANGTRRAGDRPQDR